MVGTSGLSPAPNAAPQYALRTGYLHPLNVAVIRVTTAGELELACGGRWATRRENLPQSFVLSSIWRRNRTDKLIDSDLRRRIELLGQPLRDPLSVASPERLCDQ